MKGVKFLKNNKGNAIVGFFILLTAVGLLAYYVVPEYYEAFANREGQIIQNMKNQNTIIEQE